MNFEQLRKMAGEVGGSDFLKKMDAARARQHELNDMLDEMFKADVQNPANDGQMMLTAWLEVASELAAKLTYSAGSSIPGMTVERAIKTLEKSLQGHFAACHAAIEAGAYDLVGPLNDKMADIIKAAAKKGGDQ